MQSFTTQPGSMRYAVFGELVASAAFCSTISYRYAVSWCMRLISRNLVDHMGASTLSGRASSGLRLGPQALAPLSPASAVRPPTDNARVRLASP